MILEICQRVVELTNFVVSFMNHVIDLPLLVCDPDSALNSFLAFTVTVMMVRFALPSKL